MDFLQSISRLSVPPELASEEGYQCPGNIRVGEAGGSIRAIHPKNNRAVGSRRDLPRSLPFVVNREWQGRETVVPRNNFGHQKQPLKESAHNIKNYSSLYYLSVIRIHWNPLRDQDLLHPH